MKLTHKQREIVDYARQNDNQITKKQAVKLIGGYYYMNESKHVGDVLSRMVKAGLLKRIKPGTFQLSDGHRTTKKQIDMFNPN